MVRGPTSAFVSTSKADCGEWDELSEPAAGQASSAVRELMPPRGLRGRLEAQPRGVEARFRLVERVARGRDVPRLRADPRLFARPHRLRLAEGRDGGLQLGGCFAQRGLFRWRLAHEGATRPLPFEAAHPP